MPDKTENQTENHTIRMLQEMREENRQFRDEVRKGFEDVNLRIDGLTHIMTMLAGHIHQHEERLEKLEEAKGE